MPPTGLPRWMECRCRKLGYFGHGGRLDGDGRAIIANHSQLAMKHQPTPHFAPHRSRGFSLVELLVVIAVIAVLLALVLNAATSARAGANELFIIMGLFRGYWVAQKRSCKDLNLEVM